MVKLAYNSLIFFTSFEYYLRLFLHFYLLVIIFIQIVQMILFTRILVYIFVFFCFDFFFVPLVFFLLTSEDERFWEEGTKL